MTTDGGLRRRRWWMVCVALAWIGAVLWLVWQLTPSRARTEEIETFEIELGEPIGDAVARSTRPYEFPIPLDMQSVEMVATDARSGMLEIIVRNGAGQRAVLPWQPVHGMLWMDVGVTHGLELAFADFDTPMLRGGGGPPPGATPLEAQVLGITEIYGRVMSLVQRPRQGSSCWRNELALQEAPCERVTMATAKHSAQALQQLLRDFHAQAAAEDWRDRDKTAQMLHLGQWWLPNGNLAMMSVVAVPQPGGGTAPDTGRERWPPRLVLHVSVQAYFRAGVARLMLSCYDQQAIFPQKIRYSQAQAAQIVHGLYADFFPPLVDGEPVTDPIRLASLDWEPLWDSYASDPARRQHFCDLLQRLERQAGYTGPFAPRR